MERLNDRSAPAEESSVTANALALRRVLHLAVDAALVADDAIVRDDTDALRRAIDALGTNAETARLLVASVRAADAA